MDGSGGKEKERRASNVGRSSGVVVASAKRRFPAPSAESLGKPSFLMRKRPRVLRGTGYSTDVPTTHGLAGTVRKGRNAQRAGTKFLEEIPESVRRRTQKHSITEEMEELQASMAAEVEEQRRRESAAASVAASLASSCAPSSASSRIASTVGTPLPLSPAPSTPSNSLLQWQREGFISSSSSPSSAVGGAAIGATSVLDSPLGLPSSLDSSTIASPVPPSSGDVGPGSSVGGNKGGTPSWIETCQEMDEVHGRASPVPLAHLLDHEHDHDHEKGSFEGDSDSRKNNDSSDVEPPPFSKVVCQIQNWVVRLDCVIDRLSVLRALDQARLDMRERRSLRRWARDRGVWFGHHHHGISPDREEYNRWYLARLEERTGAPPLRDFPPRTTRGVRVPVWNHSVPRASDLVLRIEGGGRTDDESEAWCAGSEMVRRPALDLYSLVYALLPRGARYDINNFSALVCPTVNPKAACLVYASSKSQEGSDASSRVVCTGGKTPGEVNCALRNLVAAIRKAGSLPLRIDCSTFRVCNVVASVLLPFCVDMDKLARICQRYCTYTPEMFPAPVLRIPELGKVAILVYPHKLIIAGSKTKRILMRALRMAVRITWQARYMNMESDGIRSMLKPHMRVLQELRNETVLDPETDEPMTSWGVAIASASSSFFSRRRRRTTTTTTAPNS